MIPFLAVFLPLLVAFGSTLRWCVERWNSPTQYFEHCWLVAPVAAFVLWRRRAEWGAVPRTCDARGWLLLVPALLVHATGAAAMVDSWSAVGIVLAVPGAALLALGVRRLRGQWPVLGLVLFLVPLPIYVESRIAFALKEFAVGAGAAVANLLGAGVVRRGDLLQPEGLAGALYVADACGGLRSLLAMATLTWCVAFFAGGPGWRRRVLLLALGPLLAIGANVVRIAVLCLMARWFGVPFAEGTGHTLANVAEWIALVLALLVLDGRLRRLGEAPAGTAGAAAAPPAAAGRTSLLLPAVVLWLLAGPLLWLSLYRPFAAPTVRAELLPDRIAGHELLPRSPAEERAFQRQLPGWRALLGTSDFVWRRYRDESGARLNVILVFHDTNWKSVHPPRLCIEGSNMEIERDDVLTAPWLDGGALVGRIVARAREDDVVWVTLSTYGTADWASGDYWQFFWHHLPLALVRANGSGFLLRVESPIGPGETQAQVEARCARFLRDLVPAVRELLR